MELDFSPALVEAFKRLWEYYIHGEPYNTQIFTDLSHQYFRYRVNKLPYCEEYLSYFTLITNELIQQNRYREAENVWKFVLEIVFQWENHNRPKAIHKGTPYYFLAETVIISGDVERGFILMHQAFTEDIRTNTTERKSQRPIVLDNPAKKFVTLDYKQENQNFYHEVLDTSSYLDLLLVNYRNSIGGSLVIDEFKRKFLDNIDLLDTITFFIFTLSKVKGFMKAQPIYLRTSSLAGLVEIGLLFDFILVIDSLIYFKSTLSNKSSYARQLEFLSTIASFSIQQHYRELNSRFDTSPDTIVGDVLSKQFKYQDGSIPSQIEADTCLSYCLRNFSAHNIKSIPSIYTHFEEIFQRVMNVLFFSVEKLYP
jgi:hypothetical protein